MLQQTCLPLTNCMYVDNHSNDACRHTPKTPSARRWALLLLLHLTTRRVCRYQGANCTAPRPAVCMAAHTCTPPHNCHTYVRIAATAVHLLSPEMLGRKQQTLPAAASGLSPPVALSCCTRAEQQALQRWRELCQVVKLLLPCG